MIRKFFNKLESGLTPIVKDDHVLIPGWTNRTPSIVRELVLSEGRVKRFLKRIGASRLNIVILTLYGSDEQREYHKGGILLNPPSESGWHLKEDDELAVLTTYS